MTARRTVASNTRFDIYFDRLEGPDGQVVPEFLMVRPKQQKGGVSGVCVLPEVEGRIGLMRSYRHQFDEDVWQAPAGFGEADEDIPATALRELREETGFDCPPERLVPLGLSIPDAGVLEAKVALFVARDAVPCGTAVDSEPGMGTLTFFARDALRALVQGTPAMGSSTLVACFRYLALTDAPGRG